MKVSLFDADNKGPNLALMKLSAYWKDQGAEVLFNRGGGEKVFISCVFTKNLHRARLIQKAYGGTIGGSGTSDYSVVLPAEVEHVCPDYSLYGLDYSMGFTSRGCCRACSFCIVPEKEGQKVVEWSPLSEFVRHKRVLILDNNFLASPEWRSKIAMMIGGGLRVDFNQGLDIRLIDEVSADWLARLNPEYLRFSWDDVSLKPTVKRGIRLLRDAGYPIDRHRLGFYILTGYNSTTKEDVYRCEFLHRLGVNTHVQVYGHSSGNLARVARWGNQPRVWIKTRFSGYTKA